jgi:hypothetical protein
MLLGGLWLMFHQPAVFLALLIVFIALTIWLLPKIFGFLGRLWRRISGSAGEPLSRPPATSSPRV